MSGRVWMSSLFSNHDIGDRVGTRTKMFDRDWDPATFKLPSSTSQNIDALRRYMQGFSLTREEFPEADAVFDPKAFIKVGNIFASAGFFVVRGKLAKVFSRFDLGDGGLIAFPVYNADLMTPLDEKFFLLNFGAHKNSFLPEASDDARKFSVVKATGHQTWQINYLNEDGLVALSPAALEGPHLWFEEAVYNKIFMSDELAQELIAIGMGETFKLKECRIVECAR